MNDIAWYEDPQFKNLFIKASSNAMRGFHSPITTPKTVFTGTNSLIDFINHLGAFLGDDEKRVLIVVDKDLRKYGEKVSKLLMAMKGIDSMIYDNVQPDVPKNTVLEGAKICDEYDPKVLIAVGGGSAMDTGKLILLLHEKPNVNLNALMAPSYLGLRKKIHWLVAIPTTSGTGAETTFIAVVTDTDRNPPKKTEVVLYELCPDFAVLIPDFVKSMPRYLTMGTGMDALAHAMGSYMLTMSNVFTDMCNEKAIELILKYLPRACQNGNDMEAREKMQLAAYFAGMGFGNVSAGIEHSLGHSLGSIFHVHHGVCVGLFLCASVAYQSKVTRRYETLARIFKTPIENRKREDVVRDLLSSIQEFMKSIKFPLSIRELKNPPIKKEDYLSSIDQLVDFAFNDYCTLSSSRKIDKPQYKRIFEICYENDIDDLMELYKL
ncbi:MAG: iron-containing alcohol dehydrogenase [Promethearchaeota archaeon]